MSSRPCAFSALIVLLALSGYVGAATLTVDAGGKGTTTTIQAAVDRAAPGDVITINPGTYSGTGNCDIDLHGKALTIQGTAPADPNVVAATVVDCKASATVAHRGFVVSGCAGARLVGLTVTNGRAAQGGAIFCSNSILDVVNCRIVNNSTLAGDGRVTLDGGCGGGIYAEGSTLEVVGCLLSDNSTSNGTRSSTGTSGNGGDGGGIYAIGTTVTLDGCTITDNHTGNGADAANTAGRGGDGGGVCADSLNVTNSTLTNNTTGRGGAGAQGGRGGNGGALLGRRSTVARSRIEGNSAGSGGTSTGSGRVTAGAGGAGGGVYCSDALTMTDCLVAGNGSGRAGLLGAIVAPASDGAGAGVWCTAGRIDHCTIVANSVLQSLSTSSVMLGAGLFCTRDTVVSNSILWDNTPDQIAGDDADKVTFCDIQDSRRTGAGDIAVNPAFAAPGAWAASGEVTFQDAWTDRSTYWVPGDYRLSNTSPCIDAGDPADTADANAVDLIGQPRRLDGRVDIGAYEFKSLLPVYHFQSPKTSRHFYTAKQSEKDKLVTTMAKDWAYQGVAFYTYVRAVEPRLKPVYRLWSPRNGAHFWTTSESEKDKLMSGAAGSWVFEGVAFYAFLEDQRPATTKPVYRFWSPTLGCHFFTIDETEKDRYVADSSVWTFEGTAWYAYDTPPAPETGGHEPPVQADSYSFTAGIDAALYQMTLKAVVDGQEARLDNATLVFLPALGHMMMNVNLDTMKASLASLYVESQSAKLSGNATGTNGSTPSLHTFTLLVNGFFNTATVRGPYAIDPGKLTFPQAPVAAQAGDEEDFVIAGSVNIDGLKADVNVTLEATSLDMQGTAVIDRTGYPDNLTLMMNGPFQWRRQGHEDLLADVTVREHRIQLYVTSLTLQTTGLWSGKNADTAAGSSR